MRARNLIDLWLVLVTRYKKRLGDPDLILLASKLRVPKGRGNKSSGLLLQSTNAGLHVAEAEGCERPIRQLAIQGTSRKVADYAMEASEQYSIVPDLHQGSLSGMVAGRSEIPPSPRGGGG